MLIGAVIFFGFLKLGQIKLINIRAKLKETKLGWIILGLILSKKSKINNNLNISLITQQVADNFDDKAATFWR